GLDDFDVLAGAGDGVLEVGLGGAGGADVALRPQGDEGDLGRVDAAAHRHLVDLADGQLAGLLGAAAGPHGLDDHHAPPDANDLLANARAASRPRRVIHV